MADKPEAQLTVGSLMQAPLEPGHSPMPLETEGIWEVRTGEPSPQKRTTGSQPGIELLTFNNPFGQLLERVWCNGNMYFAMELGEVDVDPGQVKVAQEYQIVYEVQLDARGKLIREPEHVPGQLNIYDSVPGMAKYSPIWQFNYVVVPRNYLPNTLRSESDCLNSGFAITQSYVFEN